MGSTEGNNNNWEVVSGSADADDNSRSERVPFVEPHSATEAEDRKMEQQHARDLEDIGSSKESPLEDKQHAKGDEGSSDAVSGDDETPSDVNVGASIAAGAVSGLLLGGPILSIIGAAGAGIYATEKGIVGDVVRAGGKVAVSCRERAVRLDRKHGCALKAKEAADAASRKISEVGKESKAWGKVKSSAESVGSKAKKIEREHHFLENFLMWVSNGLASLAERLNNPTSRNNETSNQNDSTPLPIATANVLPTTATLPVDIKSDVV